MIEEWVKFIVLISSFTPFSQAVQTDKRNYVFTLLIGALPLGANYIYLIGYETQFKTRF